jgi:hypothetical protein
MNGYVFGFQQSQHIFLFSTASSIVLGLAQPLFLWAPVVKRYGNEDGHKLTNTDEVKKPELHLQSP